MTSPSPSSSSPSPADRLRRSHREDALRHLDVATLALAYLANEPVVLERGDTWRWDRDGIPGWLVPLFHDSGLLP
jgi:hypothetical protein